MLDYVIRNARLAAGQHTVDIGFKGDRIAAIDVALPLETPSYEAGGCFCCAGLIETHIHLDKSRTADRCGPPAGRNAMAMKRVSEVKHTFTVDDVRERAGRTIEAAIVNGTTRMRTHVEVDPLVGMRGFDGVERAARDYAWAIEIELCVFPQEGLTNNPGTDELIVQGLKRGARAIGAAPNFDTDPAAQIRRIFELAREYDIDIDMHVDFGNSPEHMDVDLICQITDQFGWGGRVALGHVTKLSTLAPDQQRAYATRLANAGIALTVLPATDLFLMGRDQDYNVRRGVVDAHLFCAAGCNCSISTNNVLNPFTPFGDASLTRMANLHVNILQKASVEEMAACFEMITTRSANLMNLRDYGLAVGNPADVVVFDAESPYQAVAQIAAPLAVFKNGRQTVQRDRPVIHRS
jgi:cytosine deaminase